jgi:hypothetical protein
MEQPKAPEPRWPDAFNRVIAERNEARAAIERVRALHHPSFDNNGPDVCEACGCYDCQGPNWPCPTIRALDPVAD